MCAVNSFVELVFTDTVWCILYHNNVLLLSGTWISYDVTIERLRDDNNNVCFTRDEGTLMQQPDD